MEERPTKRKMTLTSFSEEASTPIQLNVRGATYILPLSLLTKYSDSMLAKKFDQDKLISQMTKPEEDGSFTLDCDPELFACIQTFLESGMNHRRPYSSCICAVVPHFADGLVFHVINVCACQRTSPLVTAGVINFPAEL
jgi:hypothetical protein